MSRFVAAIDRGTSSTRCIIVEGAGSVVASARREHRQIFPRAGRVEHDSPVGTAGWRGWHNAVDRSLGWVPNDNEENGHD